MNTATSYGGVSSQYLLPICDTNSVVQRSGAFQYQPFSDSAVPASTT